MRISDSIIKAIGNFGFLTPNNAQASITNFDDADEKQENKSDNSKDMTYRKLPDSAKCDNEEYRVLSALMWNDDAFDFNLEKLDKETLKKIATQANSANIHYSGNCVGLALCVLYNLKIGKTDLSMQNSSPFYKGLNYYTTSKLILGEETISDHSELPRANIVENLSKQIIKRFQETNERAFIINALSKKFFLNTVIHHTFNAVVISEIYSQPQVIYLDAWRKKIYSSFELDKVYKAGEYELMLNYLENKVVPLEKPLKHESKPVTSLTLSANKI